MNRLRLYLLTNVVIVLIASLLLDGGKVFRTLLCLSLIAWLLLCVFYILAKNFLRAKMSSEHWETPSDTSDTTTPSQPPEPTQ